jgi:hypothetical protein
VVSFFFFDGEHERAKKRFVREKILGEPPQRRRRIVVFRFGSGTPNVFARCSPRTRGARVGAPAPDGRTLRSATVPRRSTSHTVPCLVDASPRVMTTSCPNKDCEVGERTVRRKRRGVRARSIFVFEDVRVGGGGAGMRRRRRAWGINRSRNPKLA